jgi:hypothetical protein
MYVILAFRLTMLIKLYLILGNSVATYKMHVFNGLKIVKETTPDGFDFTLQLFYLSQLGVGVKETIDLTITDCCNCE